MKINRTITLGDFNEQESQDLISLAGLILKNKRVLNDNVTPNNEGETSTYYPKEEYERMLKLAEAIAGAK